ERVRLLYGLLATYAQRAPGMELVDELLEVSEAAEESLLLCVDLAVFEGGHAKRFLQARGAWLREDERTLIEQWVRTPLAALEAMRVRRGKGVQVRSL